MGQLKSYRATNNRASSKQRARTELLLASLALLFTSIGNKLTQSIEVKNGLVDCWMLVSDVLTQEEENRALDRFRIFPARFPPTPGEFVGVALRIPTKTGILDTTNKHPFAKIIRNKLGGPQYMFAVHPIELRRRLDETYETAFADYLELVRDRRREERKGIPDQRNQGTKVEGMG